MRYFCEKEVLVFALDGDIKTSDVHVELYLKTMQIYNSGTIIINHQNTSRKVINLQIGDLIEIDKYKFIINENSTLEFIDNEIESPGLIRIENLIQAYPDYPEYTNSPRVKYDIADEKVELERIPEKSKDTSKANLMKKLIPALVGIIVAVLMLWVRPRGIRGILMIITTFVSFAISLINLYGDRRDNRMHNENRHNIYSKYLDEKREELANLKLTELANINHNFLSTNEMISEINNCTYRLYERDIKDEDFLKLRLGTSTAEPKYQLNNPFEKLELRYEDADEQLRELYDEYIQIKHVPLICDIKNNTGLVGNRYVISEQLKNILMQIIFSHSYLDLKIIVITNEDFIEDYNYAFKMKHFSDHENTHKIFITNAKERDQFLSNYTQVLRSRKQAYKPGMLFSEHYLFIIDNPELVNNHPIMEFFESDERSLMFSIIQIAKTRNELPKYIRTVIDYRTYEEAVLELENQKVRNLEIELPKIDKTTEELEAIYLQLCNLEHIKGIKSSIPDQLGFLEMYNVKSPKELNINQRWQENHAYKSLAALMGKKSETDYLYMDLHEKVHGPHGLVAGTTGSGKSEVIQTYILSLALNFSPEQVGFLLIDYKGGGMANLFKDMPHHLGSITNLDGYQSMRALMSIKSELKRRQKIFADVNVNHINNYQKLFEQNKVEEALPHLFLISDEFAELKAEQPDFMKELVSAARIGRSLGIHLILATQKPDGVVDDQIWSNSKFKLSLKVAEEADSKALLKTSDAAYITNPGRGYLKVGNNELYELFQSGYSGAELSLGTTKKIDQEIYLLDEHGIRELLNPEDCIEESIENEETITELDAVLNEITDVYNQNKLTPIKKPWLAPLEKFMYVESNIQNVNESKLEWTAGLVDVPDQQKQLVYKINLNETGHLLITGISGMGKSKAITNALLRMAETNSPLEVKYYVLDFANGGLAQLQLLNHTADYILDYESDKLIRFIKLINEEVNSRRALLKKEFVTDVDLLDKTVYDVPRIIVALDGYAKLKEIDVNLLDEFIKMIRDCSSLGIHLMISATTYKEIKEPLKQFIFNRIILFSNDKFEVNDSIGRTEYTMQEIPGRAMIKLDKVEIAQLYYPVSKDDSYSYTEDVLKIINKINDAYDYKNESIKEMPEVVEYNDAKSDGTKLSFGVSHDDISMFELPFDSTLIIGEPKIGKTNAMKLILEQSLHLFENALIIDNINQELAYYKSRPNVSYYGTLDAIENLNVDFEYDAIIINKLDLLEQINPKELKNVYEVLGMQMLTGSKVFMEVSENISNGNRLFKQIKKATNVVIMQSLASQRVVNVSDAKLRSKLLPENSAFISVDRKINTVKLPLVKIDETSIKIQTAPVKNVKKKTNNGVMLNGTPLKIQNMVVANANGTVALENIINCISNTSYHLISNIDNEDILSENKKLELIKDYNNVEMDDNTILILDIEKLKKLERNTRIAFIEFLENNKANNFYIWLVVYEKSRVSGKLFKSIVKEKYALISGGFEKNALYRSGTIRNWDEKFNKEELVLLDKSKIIKIESGD